MKHSVVKIPTAADDVALKHHKGAHHFIATSSIAILLADLLDSRIFSLFSLCQTRDKNLTT
jgi:hypothetical protein